MRLQEVYCICRTVQESWNDLSFDEVKAAGNTTYYKLKNPDVIRETLFSLEKIESFQEIIASIRGRSYGFAQSTGVITIDPRTKSALSSDYQTLYNKIATITSLFDSLDYRQDSDGFDIKLPSQMSLSELSKCTHDLDTIFSVCPLFADQPGTITFSAVDVGSVWLSFVIGGVAVVGILKLVAELVDKAIIVRSHYLTTKAQEEQIRSLQLGNDVLDNAVNLHKDVGKGILNKAANDLAAEHDITDPEDIGRLKTSIQLLSDWMSKGLEVYASIQATPEVKAVFPPIETQALPEGVTALLTDGSSTEE